MMAQAMDMDIVGAIKIKDGLFVGDEFSAQVMCPYYLVGP